VLKLIFGPKTDEMVGGWRKFPDEELYNLHISPNNYNNQIKKDEMCRACSMHEEKRCGIVSITDVALVDGEETTTY
jgi:hypothetical protein